MDELATDKSDHNVLVTLLSRRDCPPCHEALTLLRRLQARAAFTFQYLEIDDNELLTAEYGRRVPVLLLNGIEKLSGKFSEEDLERVMKKARWRRPVSRILSRIRLARKRG